MNLTRREFSDKLAFGAFWTTIATAVMGMARLPWPSVMPEPSTRIRLGRPDEFPAGATRSFDESNVLLFSDAEGIYAFSSICPHLGCVVSQDTEDRFECPCHGSSFDPSGEVTDGPAPRGLDWLEVSQAPNGWLYVDTSRAVPSGTKWRRA